MQAGMHQEAGAFASHRRLQGQCTNSPRPKQQPNHFPLWENVMSRHKAQATTPLVELWSEIMYIGTVAPSPHPHLHLSTANPPPPPSHFNISLQHIYHRCPAQGGERFEAYMLPPHPHPPTSPAGHEGRSSLCEYHSHPPKHISPLSGGKQSKTFSLSKLERWHNGSYLWDRSSWCWQASKAWRGGSRGRWTDV